MFNSLTGRVTAVQQERVMLQGGGGIEWEITAGAQTLSVCLEALGRQADAPTFIGTASPGGVPAPVVVGRDAPQQADAGQANTAGMDAGHVDAGQANTAGMDAGHVDAGQATAEGTDAGHVRHVRLFIYLYHREDQLRLYGFVDERERTLFTELLRVSGIGPRQALRILSGMVFDRLSEVVQQGDYQALSRLPGLGIKTAQKVILALRGRIEMGSAGGSVVRPGDEIVAALVEMGHDRRRAHRVVGELRRELQAQEIAPATLDRELLRRALIQLSGA